MDIAPLAGVPPAYQHWADSLAGLRPPIHASEPQCGYYRAKFNGAAVPAYIWPNPTTGKLHCLLGTQECDPAKVWLRLAHNPISEQAARFWFEHGRWQHEPPAPDDVPQPSVGAEVGPPPRKPAIGDNSGEPAAAWLAHASEWLERHRQIASIVEADTCGDLIADGRKHLASGEASRVAEKAPHLEAGRQVDAKWKAILAPIDCVLADLKAALIAFRDTELARQAREAAASQTDAESTSPIEPSEPLRFGGTSGRRIGFKEIKHVVVADLGKALRLKAVREHPELLATVERICGEIYRATDKLPAGCEIKSETKAA